MDECMCVVCHIITGWTCHNNIPNPLGSEFPL